MQGSSYAADLITIKKPQQIKMNKELRLILDRDDVKALSCYPDLELCKDDVLWRFLQGYFIPIKCVRLLISRGASIRTFFTRNNLSDIIRNIQSDSMRSEYHTELIQMCIQQGAPISASCLEETCKLGSVEVASLLLQHWSSPTEVIKFIPYFAGGGLISDLSVPKLLIEHRFPVVTFIEGFDQFYFQYTTRIENVLAQHRSLCNQVKQECTHIVWCLKQHGVSKDTIKDMLIFIWEIKMKPHR